MTPPTDTLHQLQHAAIIGIIRAQDPTLALDQARAMVQAGIRAIEITWTTPNASAILSQLTQECPNVCWGAGSLLSPDTVNEAIDAGAVFLASPATQETCLRAAQDRGILMTPGAATPTEILTAWELGAEAIKVFPAASLGGPNYLQSIRAPLPQIPLIATGGIDLNNAHAYLKAGCIAVGIGNPITPPLGQGDAAIAQWRQQIQDTLSSLTTSPGASSPCPV